MKSKKAKIKYDREAEILSIRLAPRKSIDSDVKGNVVLDYDEKGNLVNIDIMKVSISEFARTPGVRSLIQFSKA